MATEAAVRPEEAIKLFIPEPEDGHVSSVVPLRWCISRQVAEQLNKDGRSDPHLLIVISNNDREMERYVVPLTDEMRYIQFRRPGKNVVHATIVWRQSKEHVHPRDALTAKTDKKEYRLNVLEFGRPALRRIEYERLGDITPARIERLNQERERHLENPLETVIYGNFSEFQRLPAEEAALTVDVPKEMFAKKPNRFIKGLSGVIWKSDPRDECEMRRRALITSLTSPLMMFGVILLVTVSLTVGVLYWLWNAVPAAFLLLLGKRNLDLSGIRHPLKVMWGTGSSYKTKQIWRHAGPSVWTQEKIIQTRKHDRDIVGYEPRPVFFYLVNPPVFLGAIGVELLVALMFGEGVSETMLPNTYMTVIGAGILATVVSRAVGGLSPKIFQKRKSWRESQEKTREWEVTQAIDSLACDDMSRVPDLKALPKERRTVRLRFQAFKAQVCKPFAS